MLKEIEARELLLEQLIENGYPPESLLADWRTEDGVYYDLSIVDPKTAELIALIELKVQSELIVSSAGVKHSIKRFSKTNKNNISFFFVSFSKKKLDFSQFIPNLKNFEDGELIPIKTIPKFDDLRKKTLGENRKDTQKTIEIICWVSAFITGAILVLDIIGCITVTLEHLSLLSLTIALVLIPFASKIKIFNIEFERFKNEQ